MNTKTVVVIGNGMVSHKFCEKLITKRNDFKLIVFGEEPIRAYDRVHLTDYFGNKTLDDLFLSKNEWYNENNIDLHLHDPIVHIDIEKKRIHSKKDLQIDYDYLILATGSAASVPPSPCRAKHGAVLYRR